MSILIAYRKFTKFVLSSRCVYISRRCGSDDTTSSCDDKNKNRPIYTPEEPASLDDPPTTCCMSGCHNCVYIVWAEAVSKQMANNDPIIAKKILDNVDDPNMKAFLQMELRSLGFL